MNITPHNPNIPLATVVNPQTDALRRENHQREVITQPAAASQSAAEKGVASDKDRVRTPAQNAEKIDFASIQEQAEKASKTINDEQSQGDGSRQDQASPEDANSADKEQEKAKSKGDQAQIDKQTLDNLKKRDREVRAHEQAHASAGGVVTGAPSLSFEVGPDGKKYAVDGEVSVDLSPVRGNPRATIAKMQKVYAAALAPANPSIQDTRVANSAAQLIAKAQSELLAQELDDPTKEKELNRVISNRATFTGEGLEQTESESASSDFDTFINQTLNAQEQVAPSSRPTAIDQRALRIENHYADINQAYEKPSNSQFELTA